MIDYGMTVTIVISCNSIHFVVPSCTNEHYNKCNVFLSDMTTRNTMSTKNNLSSFVLDKLPTKGKANP